MNSPGPTTARVGVKKTQERNTHHNPLGARGNRPRISSRAWISRAPPGPAEDHAETDAARQNAVVPQRGYGVNRVTWANQCCDDSRKQQNRLKHEEVAESSAQDSHRRRRLAAHRRRVNHTDDVAADGDSQRPRRAREPPKPLLRQGLRSIHARLLSRSFGRTLTPGWALTKNEKANAAENNAHQSATREAEAGVPHPQEVAAPTERDTARGHRPLIAERTRPSRRGPRFEKDEGKPEIGYNQSDPVEHRSGIRVAQPGHQARPKRHQQDDSLEREESANSLSQQSHLGP